MDGHVVNLVGNVGSAVKLSYVGTDHTPVAKFSLAVQKNPRERRGEGKAGISWFNVEAWGPLAERLTQCSFRRHPDAPVIPGDFTGARILVHGYITVDDFTRDSGEKGRSVKLTIDELFFSEKFGALNVVRVLADDVSGTSESEPGDGDDSVEEDDPF